MNKENFFEDTVVLPVYGMGPIKTLVTHVDKVDCVLEIENKPDKCAVVVNTNKYSIDLPAQTVCDMIYGYSTPEGGQNGF